MSRATTPAQGTSGPRRGLLRADLLVALAYLGLTLLLLAPLLPAFASAIPGGAIAGVDGWQNVWHLWWAEQALRSGWDPFYTWLLYHPGGVALHLQPINLSNGVLVLPVTALWGPAAGYNAAVVLAFALTALAAYAFALRLTGDRRAAFVAGLLVSFSPFHLTRLWDGQLELLTLQWLALYMLALLACAERPGWRAGLLAGAAMALVAYTSLYYALYAAVYSALFVALWLPFGRPRRDWLRLAGALTLAAATAALLLAPILRAALAARDGYLAPDPDEVFSRSATLLDFFLPSYLHPLWGDAAWRLGSAWHPLTGDWNMALGYTALLLALAGAAAVWRTTWRWTVLLIAMLALALGPRPQLGPWPLPIPAAYGLLDLLPGASLGRRPMLFAAIVNLLLAVLAAYGLRWLLAGRTPRAAAGLLAAALLLVAFEYVPPALPRLEPVRHPADAQLRGLPGAVLDIPPASFKKVAPQQAQLVHGRPILGGYLARMPRVPLVEQVPVFRQLWYMEQGDFRLLGGPDEALTVLRAYAIGSVVVRWDLVREDLRPAVAALLAQALPGITPAYADEALSIYHLPPPGRQVFALYGDGWYAEESAGGRAWRWMGAEGVIRVVNAGDRPAPVELRLPLGGYGAPRELSIVADGQGQARHTIAVQPGETVVSLSLLAPPGETRLTLRTSADPEVNAPGGRKLSVALVGPTLHAPGQ